MIQIDKEVKRQKSKLEKNKALMVKRTPIRVEDFEKKSSSSLMSMYNLDSDREDSYDASNQSPTIVIHDAPLQMHIEEVHIYPSIKKFHWRGIL